MRDRQYRRSVRQKKILQRTKTIRHHGHSLNTPLLENLAQKERQDVKPFLDSYAVYIGLGHQLKLYNAVYGSKNGLLSKYDYGAITLGTPIKTKTKKRSASYRHKGGYGPSHRYSLHDQKQITRSNNSMQDYYKYQILKSI